MSTNSTLETISRASLQPDSNNANRGTERGAEMIETSLKKLGAGRSILLDKNGRIIAGNKTAEAADNAGIDDDVIIVRTKGNKLVAVLREDLDLDDPNGKARQLAYADNRAGQVSLDFDPVIIAEDLANGLDLGDWFSDFDLEALDVETEAPPEESDAEPQISRADELQKEWGVEPGQMWRLPSQTPGNEHRVICGDCTDETAALRLEIEKQRSITFTSPPYNAGASAQLSGNTSVGDNLYGDQYDDKLNQNDWLDIIDKFTKVSISNTLNQFVNIQFLSGNRLAIIDYVHKFKNVLCDILIWNKQHAAPAAAPRVVNSVFEFVFVFGNNANRAIGTKDFRGVVSNVYNGNPQRNNEFSDIHAATMPVDFPEWVIGNFTLENDYIYEPFAGTGTTIIAAENLQRQCRAIEISPAYVAVILQRYKDAFGIEPELIDG